LTYLNVKGVTLPGPAEWHSSPGGLRKGATTMSTDKADPSKKDATVSSADDLVKTSKSGDVELTEED